MHVSTLLPNITFHYLGLHWLTLDYLGDCLLMKQANAKLPLVNKDIDIHHQVSQRLYWTCNVALAHHRGLSHTAAGYHEHAELMFDFLNKNEKKQPDLQREAEHKQKEDNVTNMISMINRKKITPIIIRNNCNHTHILNSNHVIAKCKKQWLNQCMTLTNNE